MNRRNDRYAYAGTAFGLPPGAELAFYQERVPYLDSLAANAYLGRLNTFIENLPLTSAQAQRLLESRPGPRCSFTMARAFSGGREAVITATVPVTPGEADRIARGENWESVVLGTAPLQVVMRDELPRLRRPTLHGAVPRVRQVRLHDGTGVVVPRPPASRCRW